MESQHEFKQDVDKFMDHIKKTINLRLESERSWGNADPGFCLRLRKDADTAFKECEYMVYELIDNAMEEGALHLDDYGLELLQKRSKDEDGNTVITSSPNEFGDTIEVTMKR
jgi:hypothetical protein